MDDPATEDKGFSVFGFQIIPPKVPAVKIQQDVPGVKVLQKKPEKRPHVSATQIEWYADRCGEYYRRKFIEKEPTPPPTAFLKGSAVHAGAEENFKQKIKSALDLSREKVMEISAAAFDTRFKTEGITLSREEESVGLSRVLGREKDRAVVLAGLYSSLVAPKHQPVLCEEFQRIGLNAELDLLIKLDFVNDKNEIGDLKTSKRSWNQQQADDSFQFTLYGLGYRALNKKEPAGIVIENLVDAPKNPKHVSIVTNRTMSDYKKAIDKINLFLFGVREGVFLPAPKGSWWCADGSCPFWSTCKFARYYGMGGGTQKRPFWMNFKKKKAVKK